MIKNFKDFEHFVKNNKDIKHCIIRVDLNLPSDIEDLSRVYAIKDTVLSVLDLGLDVVLISHYKRPKSEDISNPKFSLKNIVDEVSKVLEREVYFEKSSIFDIEPSSIKSNLTLFENLRFYAGETKNDDELAKRLAKFGDVYINDAFSVSHRAHASVDAITKYLPSFAGKSLEKEINGISRVTQNIIRPFTAIIGGSKVSSKIDVLKQISQTADYLIISGAMANTFLAAKGHDMKNSLLERDQFETALDILKNSKSEIILPVDFLASVDINENGENYLISDIPDDYSCFDIGDESISRIIEILNKTKTLLWNGATGAFEFANFDNSSKKLTTIIAELTKSGHLTSVIGGGETIASIGKYKQDMTFVSTAGGAFLEFIAGYKLPGLVVLEK
ncbi:MAG: phosphoglycerate kinase [Alphaproteobacteria bacterium]|nr:phosphoglycerate kinase [Alphaproteobacteria bacterium]